MTPTKTTDPQALEQVRTMWQETGSVVLTMDAHLHDKILGAVSHLPHVAAFALINALAEIRDQQIPFARSGKPLGWWVAGYDQDCREFPGNVARYFPLEPRQCGDVH